MEESMKQAINHLRSKKNRPSLQNVFHAVKLWDEEVTIENFKDVFDDCLSGGTLVQRTDKDSYMVGGCETSNLDEGDITNSFREPDVEVKCDDLECGERELVDLIKNNIYAEKERMDNYVNELREHIEFLREELLFKNKVISNLFDQLDGK